MDARFYLAAGSLWTNVSMNIQTWCNLTTLIFLTQLHVGNTAKSHFPPGHNIPKKEENE
jgi:hypothetical protein